MKARQSLMSWSGGKDCTMALYQTLNQEESNMGGLFTSFNQATQRVTMHGVPLALIEKQAEALELPLLTLELPKEVSHDLYNQLMHDRLTNLKSKGYSKLVFGDIFLEDLKEYRIDQLNKVGFSYEFPIWGRDTKELMHEFIDSGFQAIIASLNGEVLSQDFAGQIMDKYMVSQFPKEVDPCGENGEFHTFVFDGPIFKHAIKYEKGENVKKTYPSPTGNGTVDYWFCDLIPPHK